MFSFISEDVERDKSILHTPFRESAVGASRREDKTLIPRESVFRERSVPRCRKIWVVPIQAESLTELFKVYAVMYT